MKRLIYIATVILFFGIFAFSAWKLIGIGSEYNKGQREYQRLEQYVQLPEETVPVQTGGALPEGAQEAVLPSAPQWPVVDFAALQALNPDVVGWIYLPGTQVNYPIVQASDNDFYLYRLISGEHNSSGSIFLDAKASSLFLARNNPIYGHNMKNGTMFADMTRYVDQEFYEEHPVAMLITPQKNYTVHIFSAYVTDAWDDAWKLGFDDGTYGQWLEKLQNRSYISGRRTPTVSDNILTFSTCTYETEDARFLVHGILEEME